MNLGVAGIMGMMWLWERRTSREREPNRDHRPDLGEDESERAAGAQTKGAQHAVVA